MHWIKLHDSISDRFEPPDPGCDVLQNISDPNFCPVAFSKESPLLSIAMVLLVFYGLGNCSWVKASFSIAAKRRFVLLIQEAESFVPSATARTAMGLRISM
jgi:hypothetical protein